MSDLKNDKHFFTIEDSAETVIASMQNAPDARLKEIMTSAVRHLHDFIKETKPTMQEWMQAIEFLTATGKKCDDKRQEWILLSDCLGVSMLVDEINAGREEGATENTVLGPFHIDGVPHREMGEAICEVTKETEQELLVHGKILDIAGQPLAGVTMDVWQANGEGFYDVQQPDEQPLFNFRGIFTTGEDGKFHFKAVKPIHYPIPKDGPVGQMLDGLGRNNMRPAHIHFILTKEGFDTVTTHLFDSEDPFLKEDAVFGVRASLVREFKKIDDKHWELETDFVLQPSG